MQSIGLGVGLGMQSIGLGLEGIGLGLGLKSIGLGLGNSGNNHLSSRSFAINYISIINYIFQFYLFSYKYSKACPQSILLVPNFLHLLFSSTGQLTPSPKRPHHQRAAS
jgi:hypothetical protein